MFQVFYDNLIESKVSHSVWLSYVQGFQGWGIGRMSNGEFIKYDGLSGNHVLLFQALDAFLGMDRYLTDEDMVRYIPANQRNFCAALKKNCLRSKLQDNKVLQNAFTEIIKKLKVVLAQSNFVSALLTNKGLPSCAPNESDVVFKTASPRTSSNDCGEIHSSRKPGRGVTAVGQVHGE